MSTVRIYEDEMFPVYGLTDSSTGFAVEATDEQVERWQRVQAEFDTVQEEMAALYRPAKEKAAAEAMRAREEREAERKAERARVRAEQEDRERRRLAATKKAIEAGDVFDAEGNRLGRVRRNTPGTIPSLTLEVEV